MLSHSLLQHIWLGHTFLRRSFFNFQVSLKAHLAVVQCFTIFEKICHTFSGQQPRQKLSLPFHNFGDIAGNSRKIIGNSRKQLGNSRKQPEIARNNRKQPDIAGNRWIQQNFEILCFFCYERCASSVRFICTVSCAEIFHMCQKTADFIFE